MNRLIFLLVGTAMAVLPSLVSAQTVAPQRLDNIWGGQSHQPTQAEVAQQEQVAHQGLTQQQQQMGNDDIQNIYRELMESNAPPGE